MPSIMTLEGLSFDCIGCAPQLGSVVEYPTGSVGVDIVAKTPPPPPPPKKASRFQARSRYPMATSFRGLGAEVLGMSPGHLLLIGAGAAGLTLLGRMLLRGKRRQRRK